MRSLPFYIAMAPFTLLYAIVIYFRNFLFDIGILRSYKTPVPTICVGNLSMGGTGKTPHTEFLVSLSDEKKIAVLSRGYGRKTKGFREVQSYDDAKCVGDEPLQMKKHYPAVRFFVCENRKKGVQKILQLQPDTVLIILDDAFQHRRVRPTFNIVLSDISNLFTKDFFIPWGTLRDSRRSLKRADVVVITKCPLELSNDARNAIKKNIRQEVLFSSLKYGEIYDAETGSVFEQELSHFSVLAFAAIANASFMKKYLNTQFSSASMLAFRDHANYDDKKYQAIKASFESLHTNEKIILTTEKDLAKIDVSEFNNRFAPFRLMVLPVTVVFHNNDEAILKQRIQTKIGIEL